MSELLWQLSPEGRILLDQAMSHMDAMYDEGAALLAAEWNGKKHLEGRASSHYALGLLIRGGEGDLARAVKVLHAVCQTQYDAPEEIFHGTFGRVGYQPPKGALPWRDIPVQARYFIDCFYENTVNAFRKKLASDESLRGRAAEIEAMLGRSVVEQYPVVWETYDPNMREFYLTTIALILIHFERQLPAATVAELDHAGRIGLAGALERSRSLFSPLNTNIEIMHAFVVDYYAARFQLPDAARYAEEFAQAFADRYDRHHAVAEFNSPTYCGVDLTAIAFWRQYAASGRIRALGARLESAIWADIADFYNPAMNQICGPYSRNYEMDIAKHTAFDALLFLGMGREKHPQHPFSTESDHNPLLVLGEPRIPAPVQERFLHASGERMVRHAFEELSERGDPRDNHALCTATAWITDTLMIGGLLGSRNPSNQLHPATIHWRDCKGGVSSMRMRRCDVHDGQKHYHYVYFNCEAKPRHLSADFVSDVKRQVKVYFEFEGAALEGASFTRECWRVGGLTLRLAMDAPAFTVEKHGDEAIRVCFLSDDEQPETRHMHFEMDASLD